VPSPYKDRGDPDDTRRKNFAKALSSPRYHPPRPFRSTDESHMIRRFAFQWFTCAGSKPSLRSWAAQLGVSRTWLQKLVREFKEDPTEMLQAQAYEGDPRLSDLLDARERSEGMRRRGELRPLKYQCWKLQRRREREWLKQRQQREQEDAYRLRARMRASCRPSHEEEN